MSYGYLQVYYSWSKIDDTFATKKLLLRIIKVKWFIFFNVQAESFSFKYLNDP